MITKEQFDKLYTEDIKKIEYDQIIAEIDDRFSEIVNLLFKKYYKWYAYANVDYRAEGSMGYFDIKDYKENICIGGELSSCSIPEPYCWAYEGIAYIPTRWLWTDK